MRDVDPGSFNTKIAATRREADCVYIAGGAWLVFTIGLVATIARFA